MHGQKRRAVPRGRPPLALGTRSAGFEPYQSWILAPAVTVASDTLAVCTDGRTGRTPDPTPGGSCHEALLLHLRVDRPQPVPLRGPCPARAEPSMGPVPGRWRCPEQGLRLQ